MFGFKKTSLMACVAASLMLTACGDNSSSVGANMNEDSGEVSATTAVHESAPVSAPQANYSAKEGNVYYYKSTLGTVSAVDMGWIQGPKSGVWRRHIRISSPGSAGLNICVEYEEGAQVIKAHELVNMRGGFPTDPSDFVEVTGVLPANNYAETFILEEGADAMAVVIMADALNGYLTYPGMRNGATDSSVGMDGWKKVSDRYAAEREAKKQEQAAQRAAQEQQAEVAADPVEAADYE